MEISNLEPNNALEVTFELNQCSRSESFRKCDIFVLLKCHASPLKPKINIQSVLRTKHIPSRLYKPVNAV